MRRLAWLLLALPFLLGQDYGSGLPTVGLLSAPPVSGPLGSDGLIAFTDTEEDISLVTTSGDDFTGIAGGFGWDSSHQSRAQLVAAAGTLKDLSVKLSGDIGTAGDDLTVSLLVNGLANIACTIEGEDVGDQTTCPGATSITVAAWDTVAYKMLAAGTVASVFASYNLTWTPMAAGNARTLPSHTQLLSATDRYMSIYGYIPDEGTPTQARHVLPLAGTIGPMGFELDAVPGAGNSRTFTLQVNGGDTTPSITCTISGAIFRKCNTSAIAAETISAGDTAYIKITTVGAGTPNHEVMAGTLYTPTADAFPLLWMSDNTQGPTLTEYAPIAGANDNWSTIETFRQTHINEAVTLTDAYMVVRTAPGAAASGKARDFTVRDDGAGTALTCQILEDATTCNDTGESVSAGSGGMLAVETVPTDSPTNTAGFAIGIAATLP